MLAWTHVNNLVVPHLAWRVTMRQIWARCWWSVDFQRGSEFNSASKGPIKGAKMTITDILKFTDIKNGVWITDNE